MVVLICVMITPDKFLIKFITTWCLEDVLSVNHIFKNCKVCVHVCICVLYIYVYAHAREGADAHVLTHRSCMCLLQSLFTLIFEARYLIDLLFGYTDWPLSSMDSFLLHKLQMCTAELFFMSAWDPNLGFHGCTKSALPNKLYHHSRSIIWKWKENLQEGYIRLHGIARFFVYLIEKEKIMSTSTPSKKKSIALLKYFLLY